MNEATNNVNDIVEYEITSETTCEVVKVGCLPPTDTR